MIPSFRHLRAGIDKVSAIQYNRLVDTVEALYRSLMKNGFIDTSGIYTRRQPVSTFNMKIFEVQAVADTPKDGVYKCYEQTLDKDEWADTAGDDKFDNLNTDVIEVLNLEESNPVSDYTPALCKYDRLACWQWKDDESNRRWVGIPIEPSVRMAKTTEAAPAATNINCNIILNDGTEAAALGSGIEVYCKISGGNNLDEAVPYLNNDDYIFVENLQGMWWCTTPFTSMDICA